MRDRIVGNHVERPILQLIRKTVEEAQIILLRNTVVFFVGEKFLIAFPFLKERFKLLDIDFVFPK